VSIRIALIGNMNNNHFAMVRYLRACGIDADLLLFDNELEHFHPKADTYDTEYMHYTRQLSWGSSMRFLQTTAKQTRNDLAEYDILIGCGLAPAYCHKARRSLDIFIPYGDDIWSDTFYRFVSPQYIPRVWRAVYYQRRAIGKSKVFHMSKTHCLYERQYQRYKGLSERWYEGIPMVYSPGYKRENLDEMISHTHWGHEFLKIRKESNLMVISHMRHAWRDPSDPSAKGNDILLRGWKLFTERNKQLKAKIVLIEFGGDVERSRALVRELDLNGSVVWLPKMFRKDIMVGLHMVDIVCGEFVNSWMTSGILYEALVAGKPILAWRDDKLYEQDYSNLFPIFNAKDPESIADRLQEYVQNPLVGQQMAEIGQQWYEKEVVTKTLDKYMRYIEKRTAELGKH